uniref:ABC transporter domain-containing protein n=1 Tax=Macrostomum lignano TaxID=282301 RepID=A0A1I8FP99_9PLAT
TARRQSRRPLPVEDIGVQKERRDRLLKKQPVTCRSALDCRRARIRLHKMMIRWQQPQVLSLAKAYPRAPSRAVNDVTFGARAGQIFGLLGPNGAGKSTTLSVLVGEALGQPRPLAWWTAPRAVRRPGWARSDTAAQYSPLHATITAVLEHLQFYARVRGCRPEVNQSAVQGSSGGYGLAKYRATCPLAACLAATAGGCVWPSLLLGNRTSVLVIDEASTGVDPENEAVDMEGSAGRGRQLPGPLWLTTQQHGGGGGPVLAKLASCTGTGKNYTLDVQMKARPAAGPASGMWRQQPRRNLPIY